MKGHAKIELTDTKTGKTQIIEKDNMVTNWLSVVNQAYLADRPDRFSNSADVTLVHYNTVVKQPRTPLTDFGGIILFKEKLAQDPDDPSNYYPKVSATMIGHADNSMYSGVDLTRGSFNSILSTVDYENKTATLVWDFNREQGNGVIGTVCLCNHTDGSIGYGSKYYPEFDSLSMVPYCSHTGRITGSENYSTGVSEITIIGQRKPYNKSLLLDGSSSFSIDRQFIPVWIDSVHNELVCIGDMINTVGDCSLVFARAKMNMTSIDALAKIPTKMGSTGLIYDAPTAEAPIQVNELARFNQQGYSIHKNYYRSFYGMLFWSGLDYAGNFWFTDANNSVNSRGTNDSAHEIMNYWAAGEAKIFHKLNLSTMEISDISVTNTTGEGIRCNLGASILAHLCCLYVSATHLFIRNNHGYLFAINLANNSDVHEVVDETGKPLQFRCDASELNDTVNSTQSMYGWSCGAYGNYLCVNTIGGLQADASYVDSDNRYAVTYMYLVDMTTFVAKPVNCCANPGAIYIPTNTEYPYRYYSGEEMYPCFKVHEAPIGLRWYSYMTSRQVCIDKHDSDNEQDWEWYFMTGRILGELTYLPFALLTINTLDSAVTKTSDMTMRITYTLTSNNSATP